MRVRAAEKSIGRKGGYMRSARLGERGDIEKGPGGGSSLEGASEGADGERFGGRERVHGQGRREGKEGGV